MRSSDSLNSISRGSGFPSPSTYSPEGENQGLPSCWIVLFMRAMVIHPARSGDDSPFSVATAVAFGEM